MDFKQYSEKSSRVLIFPTTSTGDLNIAPLYLALGVNGEAGELGEKVKKVYRDKNGVFDEESTLEIKKEVGDTLWYLNQISKQLGFTLEEAAELNLVKLESRIQREVLQSSGDNR